MNYVQEVGLNGRSLAVLRTTEGQTQKITWESLRAFWSYATRQKCEYLAVNIQEDFFIVNLTTASGQGGIVAIWSISEGKWVHVQEASFVICSLILPALSAVVTMHAVSCWGTPYHLDLRVTTFGILNAIDETSTRIDVEWIRQSFDPSNLGVVLCVEVFNDELPAGENKAGPTGIFWDKENQVIHAHRGEFHATCKSNLLQIGLKKYD